MNIALSQKSNINEAMNRYNLMRGLMAIWIILGHCSIEFEKEILPLYFIHKFNLVWVGVFFFLSGWGLEISNAKKTDYLKGFLKKKTIYILKKTINVWIFSILILMLVGEEYNFYPLELIKNYFSTTNWYMWELLFFYYIYYLTMKYSRNNKIRLYIIFSISLCMVIFLPFTNIGTSYYFSCLSFCTGILLYRCRERLQNYFERFPIKIMIILVIISFLCTLSLLLPQKNSISALGKNIMCISVALMGVILFMNCSLKGRWLKFFSTISPQLYLYQFPILTFYRIIWQKNMRDIGIDYVVVVTVSTIVISSLVYLVEEAYKNKRENKVERISFHDHKTK